MAESADTRNTSPGEILRGARELYGWTLEEVAAELNLLPHVVEALETDDYSHTAGWTYAVGYLRNYARLAGVSIEQAIADLLAIDAEDIQRALHVAGQCWVLVQLAYRLNHLLCSCWAASIKLQQAVATRIPLGELGSEHLARLFDNLVERFIVEQRIGQGISKGIEQVAAHPMGRAERVHAFVVPAHQALAGAAGEVGHVQLNSVALADPVQAANALL